MHVLAVVAPLLVVAALAFALHGAFRRHALAKTLLFVAFSLPFAYYAVSKGSGGDRGGSAAPPAGPVRELDPEPAATNVTAALRFTSISVSSNGVDLVAAVDHEMVDPGDSVLLYHSYDIESNDWSVADRTYVPQGATNLVFAVAISNPPPPKSFYRLAQGLRIICTNLPYATRADGSRVYVALSDTLTLTTTGGPEGGTEPGSPPPEDPFAGQSVPHEYDPTNGTLAVSAPGELELPNGDGVLCLSPSVSFGGSHKYHGDTLVSSPGTRGDGWTREEIPAYPLDGECLWESWYEGTNVVGGSVCSCEPEFDAGIDVSEYEFLSYSVTVTGETAIATFSINGTNIWSGSAGHDPEGSSGGSSDYFSSEGGSGDPCGGCASCASGDCDALDGPSLGSVRFRIALGTQDERHVSGFLWFSRDALFCPNPSSFSLMKRSDANVADTTADGVRTVTCFDAGGRTLVVSNIADGVRLDVTFTASGARDRAWEIVSEGNAMRFRKFNARGDLMSDVSYLPHGGGWSTLDNTSGVVETKSEEGSLTGHGWRWTETVRSCGGVTASVVRVKSEIIGGGPDALSRETERMERRADGSWSRSCASYWVERDGHGSLRMERGDDRAWSWHGYDSRRRETFRLDQRGGSAAPEDEDTYSIDELPESTDAFATVLEYEPHPGDSCDTNDWDKVRTESRYAVSDGAATLIARTWTRYVRGFAANGWPTVEETTIRACSPSARIDDPGNAVSTRTVYSSDSPLVPYLLRGETVAETDEDGVTETHSHTILSNSVVRIVVSRSKGAYEAKTRAVTERDLAYGDVLYEATQLASDPSVEFGWRRHVYDSRHRLRFTQYDDGSFETNAYNCCQLLSRTDRNGAKTLHCAAPETEKLYHAEEEVYLSQLPRSTDYHYAGGGQTAFQNAFRVTQHYMDAFGRETNTVVRSDTTQGASTNMSSTATRWYVTNSRTEYPAGFSDWTECIDDRGLRTICHESESQGLSVSVTREIPPDAFEPDCVTTDFSIRGGGSVSCRVANGHAVTERRFAEYASDGTRRDYVVTESDDCGVVTNSVTTCDFLGRVSCVATPLSCVSNVYDGAMARVSWSLDLVSGLVTTNLYDDVGESVGGISRGVRSEVEAGYEFLSNVWWRVERQAVSAGTKTNSVVETRTQLTSLSNDLRSRHVAISDGAVTERVESSFNPVTLDATETAWSATGGETVRKTRFGRVIEETSPAGTTWNYYDFFGWKYYVKRSRPSGGTPMRHRFLSHNAFGDIVGDEICVGGGSEDERWKGSFYGYDCRGNATEAENALGETVERQFDCAGRVTAEDGDTYPLRFGYDSAGRRTSLRTTRDGSNWDATAWTYDAATGLCTAKTYADGSTVTNTWAADGLPLRVASPSGRWRENEYNARRELVTVEYSDGTADRFDYDVFSYEIAISNADSVVALARDRRGMVTNETAIVGDEICAIERTFDAYGRLESVDGLHFEYDAAGRLATVSNALAVVEYQYSSDGQDIGYSVTLSNGLAVSRSLMRDNYRRSLVTNIVSSVGLTPVETFAYSYDALSRPVSRNLDSFGYNARSEVASASVSGLSYAYGYDEIGNSTNWTANNLNEYAEFGYDADGNMLSDGVRTYTYDAANRLKTVSIDGVVIQTNFYDAKSRRVKKVTPEATHTYFYDGWNLIEERVAYTSGTTSTIRYYWGKDLSGTLQGAGGVGGLLYLTVSDSSTPNSSTQQLYIPLYDNNGNITRYVDENGNTVAQYTYDAFGNTIAQFGPLVDFFRHRFSTKYFDAESGLYYYGYRFYLPVLMRWMSRDPIGEEGGLNMYGFCNNNPFEQYDKDGRAFFAYRPLDSFLFRHFVIGNRQDEIDNTMIAHEQLFFEDGGIPTNLGYFDDNTVRSDTAGIAYQKPHSKGWNDCIMRKAVRMVKTRRYKLLDIDLHNRGSQYNCQDWAADVRWAYYCIVHKIQYYPQGTTFIGGRP